MELNQYANCTCIYCEKIFKSLSGTKFHEKYCKLNPNRDFLPFRPSPYKGKTKENCEAIRKQSETMKKNYKENPEFLKNFKEKKAFLGKRHSEETKKKISASVSKSRIEGYANGTITPAKGVGKGKYSYFVYSGKKFLLRSTFEFIYALYLADQKIDFDYEKIRVPAVYDNIKDNEYFKENTQNFLKKKRKTLLSDFNIGNTIVEIKGIRSEKDILIKESFEKAGYAFKEVFVDEILKIKKSLNEKGYDIDKEIRNICECHNKAKKEESKYYVHIFDSSL